MSVIAGWFLICGLWSASATAAQAPVKLLNDGNKIPIIALGTGRGTAQHGADNQEVRQAVLWAIEAGYRHIDTAAMYKDEVEVGQGVNSAIDLHLVNREDMFITTKLWNDRHRRDQVVPALRESLEKLNLQYVDLYLIHFPISTKHDGSPDDVDYLETWQGMEEAKQLGLAKSIGVSNFNISQLDRLIANSKVKPAVNQIEVNPSMTQKALVDHCKKLDIALMAYSPFGFLVSRRSADNPPPRRDDPTLVTIAKKYAKSVEQVVLRYLIDRGLIPVPKSTNQQRIQQNIDLFEFKLMPEDIEAINAFNANKRVITANYWKEYPNFPFVEDEVPVSVVKKTEVDGDGA